MQKRRSRLEVRLSDEEMAMLDERVRASGRSRSDYVRHRLEKAGGTGVPAVTAEGLREALVELKRCGNNANQIARRLNAGYPAPAADECLKELSAATAKVAEAVRLARDA